MATQPEIEDQIEIGAMPGGNDVPPTPGRTVPVRAGAGIEYTAGRPYGWYLDMPTTLPWSLDDITGDFGSDIYERMLLDTQVRSVFSVLKASVLETGLGFDPAVEDADEDGYDQSKELVATCERMIDDLDTSIDDVLWDMMDAIGTGHRVAEQVFELDATYTGKSQYLLRRLDVKPREATAFVVDAYNHCVGILARIPGQAMAVQQGMVIPEPDKLPNMLPRSKFAIFTFRPHNNDPRGTSVLRPCFTPWQLKQQIQKEWVKYLVQFASPSIIGFTAQNAQRYIVLQSDGTPMLDANGAPVFRSPEQDMIESLEAFANGTATAFSYGSEVEVINPAGEGQAFIQAYQLLNREIAKVVLNQTLATEEGENQSRASSTTHKDILDTIVLLTKRPLERMIRRDMLRTWLTLNGQQKLMPLLPKPTLGSVEREDISRLIGAVASLYSVGYIHPSQLGFTDRLIGMGKRNPPGAPGISVREQIQVKEDGGPVDASDAGAPAKKVKVQQQAQGGDLGPQGAGPGGAT